MPHHTLYALMWRLDGYEVTVLEKAPDVPRPPGVGWRRGCQPLRDGRWTWLLTLPVRSPPPPGAPMSAEWATHTPMENA